MIYDMIFRLDFLKKEVGSMNNNYCRRYFCIGFSAITSLYFLTSLLFVFVGIKKDAINTFLNDRGPFVTVLVLLSGFIIFLYPSVKLYDGYLGPKLRKRGWNEFSYFSGLKIFILTIGVIQILWGFVFLIIYQLFLAS